MESRLNKTRRNVVSSLIQNAVNLLLALAGRIIFVKVLGASFLGVNGLFTNVLNILSLADLGMSTAMMFHLYRPIAQNNIEEISSLVLFFKKIYLGIAAAIFVMGLILIPFLRYLINLPEGMPQVYVYYLAALLNVVISYMFVYRTTLVAADQKTYILNRYIITFKVATFLAQALVLYITEDYLLYLLAALLLNFLCNLLQNRAAIKLYPFLREKAGHTELSREERSRVFRDIKATFLYKICGTIQSNTDSILTSVFVGTIFVGYYSNYMLIISQMALVIGILFDSAKASVGNLLAEGGKGDSTKWDLFNAFDLLGFMITAFTAVCFYSLSSELLQFLFGRDYVLNCWVVLAVTLNFYTNHTRQPIWMFRETSGLFEPMKYITAVTAVINLILSIVFGKLWGMFGIIIATVLARMAYAWWKEPMILYQKYLKRDPGLYYVTYAKRILLCFSMCFVSRALCDHVRIGDPFLSLLIKTVICTGFTAVVLLAVCHKNASFQYLMDRVLPGRIRKILQGRDRKS